MIVWMIAIKLLSRHKQHTQKGNNYEFEFI